VQRNSESKTVQGSQPDFRPGGERETRIWLYDVIAPVKITVDIWSRNRTNAMLSPDGNKRVFSSDRKGTLGSTKSDRWGGMRVVLEAETAEVLRELAPDGKFLYIEPFRARTVRGVRLGRCAFGGRKPSPIFKRNSTKNWAEFRRWQRIVYTSNDIRKDEVT